MTADWLEPRVALELLRNVQEARHELFDRPFKFGDSIQIGACNFIEIFERARPIVGKRAGECPECRGAGGFEQEQGEPWLKCDRCAGRGELIWTIEMLEQLPADQLEDLAARIEDRKEHERAAWI